MHRLLIFTEVAGQHICPFSRIKLNPWRWYGCVGQNAGD